MKKKNVCGIGGQAVLEGVMMRGKSSYAIAVRNGEGEIVMESERPKVTDKKKKALKIPVLRGIISFFDAFVSGLKITMRASEVFGEADEAPSKFEKWLAKTFKIDIMNVVLTVGGVLGIILAIALFVVLPQIAALGIFAGAGLIEVNMDAGVWNAFRTSTTGLGFWWNMLYEVIRGVVRIVVFVGYIALVSLMKDIKRLFMYHGAEHKVISCYEHGLPLTVENAKTMSTKHDRCGTTFLFIVMIVSMLFFTVVPVSMIDVGNGFLTFIVQLVIRLALIPVVAGISYEFLKLFAKYDNLFSRACKAPGLWLQRLTTKEPDEKMLEVSIAAFNEVLKLESDPEYPTKKFVTFTTVEKAVAVTEKILGEGKKHEAELIAMTVTGAERKSDLYDGRRISKQQLEECKKYAKNRLGGAPLQYVLGETCFYGFNIKTDTRALIPRFDTEFLAEEGIKAVKEIYEKRGSKPEVLDLCTGSGCVAIAVKKGAECEMYASDVSKEALELAKENAERLGADIKFYSGSLFIPFRKKQFDIILSNPPYIPSGDINGLDKEVKDYEPRLALDGGADGLDYYRDICSSVKKHLKNGGKLILEAGAGQAEKVAEMLEGFETEFISDYNNPPVKRVIKASLTETVEDGEEEKADRKEDNGGSGIVLNL